MNPAEWFRRNDSGWVSTRSIESYSEIRPPNDSANAAANSKTSDLRTKQMPKHDAPIAEAKFTHGPHQISASHVNQNIQLGSEA
jgi:hypothetical protein